MTGTSEQDTGATQHTGTASERIPALYIGHGAPPLVDDETWPDQLAAWAGRLPRPTAVLVVSAHWESAPLTIGATTPTPLVYDFWGFPRKYYEVTYDAPGAPELAKAVKALMPAHETVAEQPDRGLDHGAYVPLTVMYPAADVPTLQISLPTLDPKRLFDLGRRLRPLREQGVLILGSGFLTHGLRYLRMLSPTQAAPGWSAEFDAWAGEALARGDVDELLDYRRRAPALPYAHPTVEHLAPMFVTLGAADDAEIAPSVEIEGYWYGLSKRSFQVA